MNKISDTTKKIAGNTFFQLFGKAATMSITILATILVTRAYGREAYGEFSLMQGWPAILYIIVDFGFNAIAVRELSKNPTDSSKVLGNILLFRVALSALFIAALWVLLIFFPYSESLKFGIRLSLFLILTQALFTSANIIFQSKLRYDYSAVSLIGGYLVILALIILFSYLKLSVVWISFSYVIGGLVTFIFSTFFIKKLGVSINFSYDPKIFKYLFWQTLPLGIMFVFSQMNFKEDEILLSVLKLPQKYQLSNTESVAVYALPYKIFEVALVLPTFFMNSVYPVMLRHLLESKEKLKSTLFSSLRFLFILAILAGVAGYIFSPLAIKVLGGDSFSQSVDVLRILLAGLVFYYITQPLSWLLVTLEKQKYLPYIYLAASVFNLSANLIFIPKYSFYGAAIVTHASEAFILIMLIYAAGKAWKQYSVVK